MYRFIQVLFLLSMISLTVSGSESEKKQCDIRVWYLNLIQDDVFLRELSPEQRKIKQSIENIVVKGTQTGEPRRVDCDILVSFDKILKEKFGYIASGIEHRKTQTSTPEYEKQNSHKANLKEKDKVKNIQIKTDAASADKGEENSKEELEYPSKVTTAKADGNQLQDQTPPDTESRQDCEENKQVEQGIKDKDGGRTDTGGTVFADDADDSEIDETELLDDETETDVDGTGEVKRNQETIVNREETDIATYETEAFEVETASPQEEVVELVTEETTKTNGDGQEQVQIYSKDITESYAEIDTDSKNVVGEISVTEILDSEVDAATQTKVRELDTQSNVIAPATKGAAVDEARYASQMKVTSLETAKNSILDKIVETSSDTDDLLKELEQAVYGPPTKEVMKPHNAEYGVCRPKGSMKINVFDTTFMQRLTNPENNGNLSVKNDTGEIRLMLQKTQNFSSYCLRKCVYATSPSYCALRYNSRLQVEISSSKKDNTSAPATVGMPQKELSKTSESRQSQEDKVGDLHTTNILNVEDTAKNVVVETAAPDEDITGKTKGKKADGVVSTENQDKEQEAENTQNIAKEAQSKIKGEELDQIKSEKSEDDLNEIVQKTENTQKDDASQTNKIGMKFKLTTASGQHVKSTEEIEKMSMHKFENYIRQTSNEYALKLQNLELLIVKLENQLLMEKLNKQNHSSTITRLEFQILKLENDLLKMNRSYTEMKEENIKMQERQGKFLEIEHKKNEPNMNYPAIENMDFKNIEIITEHKAKIHELTELLNNQTSILNQMKSRTEFLEDQNRMLHQMVMNQTAFMTHIMQRVQGLSEENFKQKQETKELNQKLEESARDILEQRNNIFSADKSLDNLETLAKDGKGHFQRKHESQRQGRKSAIEAEVKINLKDYLAADTVNIWCPKYIQGSPICHLNNMVVSVCPPFRRLFWKKCKQKFIQSTNTTQSPNIDSVSPKVDAIIQQVNLQDTNVNAVPTVNGGKVDIDILNGKSTVKTEQGANQENHIVSTVRTDKMENIRSDKLTLIDKNQDRGATKLKVEEATASKGRDATVQHVGKDVQKSVSSDPDSGKTYRPDETVRNEHGKKEKDIAEEQNATEPEKQMEEKTSKEDTVSLQSVIDTKTKVDETMTSKSNDDSTAKSERTEHKSKQSNIEIQQELQAQTLVEKSESNDKAGKVVETVRIETKDSDQEIAEESRGTESGKSPTDKTAKESKTLRKSIVETVSNEPNDKIIVKGKDDKDVGRTVECALPTAPPDSVQIVDDQASDKQANEENRETINKPNGQKVKETSNQEAKEMHKEKTDRKETAEQKSKLDGNSQNPTEVKPKREESKQQTVAKAMDTPEDKVMVREQSAKSGETSKVDAQKIAGSQKTRQVKGTEKKPETPGKEKAKVKKERPAPLYMSTDENDQREPRDCYDHYSRGQRKNGLYKIRPTGHDRNIQVFCDMKNGGWTIIMKRQDGTTNFYKDWDDYKVGFGGLYGEHWLGNDNIHLLTNQDYYSLRVDLMDWKLNRRHALYSYFLIQHENESYRLHVEGYSGDAGDGFSKHDGNKFSTKDVDNDKVVKEFGGSCANRFHGAGWYYKCYMSNLNGRYYRSGTIPEKQYDGITWKPWTGPNYSLKLAEMKIRPVSAK